MRGEALPTSTDEVAEVPLRFSLQGNYPNPFNPTTTIVFDLPEAASVRLEVFDLLGRSVLALPARQLQTGAAQTIQIDAGALTSGVYFYRITASTDAKTLVDTGRMLLLK